MSNRRSFLRDVLMTCAISLLPKVLQPQLPEVLDEDITERSFEGIIPSLKKHGNIIQYRSDVPFDIRLWNRSDNWVHME